MIPEPAALGGASQLSLLAALFYLAIAGAALLASRRGAGRFWLAMAAGFGVFALMRALAVEDVVRDWLRDQFSLWDIYGKRGGIQAPLSVAVLFGAAVIAFLALRSSIAANGERAILGAKIGLGGMITLIGLRLISLHSVDGFLFSPLIGSIRLNWLLDIGFGAMALLSALYFYKTSRSER